jgi:hypothetical protein
MSEPLVLTSEDDGAVEDVPSFDVYRAAARRKLGAPDAWEWYALEAIGRDTLVTGGIPSHPSAKNGRLRWQGVKGERVVLSRADIVDEKATYERDTGRCADCAGSGKTLRAAGKRDGKAYREYGPCRTCSGNGSAPTSVQPGAGRG